jgi:hypothetical protein
MEVWAHDTTILEVVRLPRSYRAITVHAPIVASVPRPRAQGKTPALPNAGGIQRTPWEVTSMDVRYSRRGQITAGLPGHYGRPLRCSHPQSLQQLRPAQ